MLPLQLALEWPQTEAPSTATWFDVASAIHLNLSYAEFSPRGPSIRYVVGTTGTRAPLSKIPSSNRRIFHVRPSKASQHRRLGTTYDQIGRTEIWSSRSIVEYRGISTRQDRTSDGGPTALVEPKEGGIARTVVIRTLPPQWIVSTKLLPAFVEDNDQC